MMCERNQILIAMYIRIMKAFISKKAGINKAFVTGIDINQTSEVMAVLMSVRSVLDVCSLHWLLNKLLVFTSLWSPTMARLRST